MHRNSFSDFDRARQMLEHLIDRSRRHPITYAWLAKWHVLKVQQGWTQNPAQDTQLAQRCIQQALENDPACALAWTIDGFVHTNLLRQLDAADHRYDQALTLNPNDSLAWLLKGMLRAFAGDGEPAMTSVTRATALSPLDPLRYFYDSLTASACISNGQYEESIQMAKRSLQHNMMHTSTYRALAMAQALTGRLVEAKHTVNRLLDLDPSFTVEKFSQRYPGKNIAPEYAEKLANALLLAGAPAR